MGSLKGRNGDEGGLGKGFSEGSAYLDPFSPGEGAEGDRGRRGGGGLGVHTSIQGGGCDGGGGSGGG